MTPCFVRGGGGGERVPYERTSGMLVVSLRGVKFGIWSHLGCLCHESINILSYLAVKVSFRVAHEKIASFI